MIAYRSLLDALAQAMSSDPPIKSDEDARTVARLRHQMFTLYLHILKLNNDKEH